MKLQSLQASTLSQSNLSTMRMPLSQISASKGCSRFGDGCCCPAEVIPNAAIDAAMPIEPLSALAIAAGSILSSFFSMFLFFGGGSSKPKP